MNIHAGSTQKEFMARLLAGAMIEGIGIIMVVLQYFDIYPVTLYTAGTEDVTLLHLGAFFFVLGTGLQVRAVFSRVTTSRKSI